MNLARMAAARATCSRRMVGAVLTLDKRVISTGYNGAPSGMRQCDEVGCLMYQAPGEERPRCIRTIHAEINALTRAKEQGSHLYCTDLSCVNCLKAALSHNPYLEIWYWRDYPDEARDLFVIDNSSLICQLKKVSEKIEKEMLRFLPLMEFERC